MLLTILTAHHTADGVHNVKAEKPCFEPHQTAVTVPNKTNHSFTPSSTQSMYKQPWLSQKGLFTHGVLETEP